MCTIDSAFIRLVKNYIPYLDARIIMISTNAKIIILYSKYKFRNMYMKHFILSTYSKLETGNNKI